MIKLNIRNLPMKEFEILKLAFGVEIDEIDFENENDVFESSEVIGYHKAAEIVGIYGWYEAQKLADELGISAPLANIETVASAIVTELVLTYGKEE